METPEQLETESDPRFPSGPWTGFFLQPRVPGRHLMELRMTFQHGTITGEGRDWVGEFTLRGRYDLADGQCHWTKRYANRHDVFYRGFNEGKGIWGVWEIAESEMWHKLSGGFYIWPEGMADPTGSTLHAAKELPHEKTRRRKVSEPAGV